MKIEDKIKTYRKEKGWTQKELAELLHLSDKTISSWETGRTYPDLDNLIQLADLFELTLDELIREDKKMIKNLDKKIKRSTYTLPVIIIGLVLIVLITYMTLSPNSFSGTIMMWLSAIVSVGLTVFVLKMLYDISKK